MLTAYYYDYLLRLITHYLLLTATYLLPAVYCLLLLSTYYLVAAYLRNTSCFYGPYLRSL